MASLAPVEIVEPSQKAKEKERMLKVIEEKLSNYHEKLEHEKGDVTVVKKKSSHFWSDFKVYIALSILVVLAIAAVLVKV